MLDTDDSYKFESLGCPDCGEKRLTVTKDYLRSHSQGVSTVRMDGLPPMMGCGTFDNVVRPDRQASYQTRIPYLEDRCPDMIDDHVTDTIDLTVEDPDANELSEQQSLTEGQTVERERLWVLHKSAEEKGSALFSVSEIKQLISRCPPLSREVGITRLILCHYYCCFLAFKYT